MNKKASLISTLVIFGVLVVLGIGLYSYLYFSKQGVDINPNDESSFIKIRLYDANGNLIIPTSALSIVNGIAGVSFIDLTITATNDGSIPLTCDILGGSVTPSTFDVTLPRSIKTLPIGGKVEWTSNLVAVSSFEGLAQPTRFQATVRCSYTNAGGTQLLDQSGYSDIRIIQDGTGSFRINIGPGGIPAAFCGDGNCSASAGETATNCPTDCGTQQKAKFRTAELTYVSGSAIAYINTCGSVLNRYGYDSASCWTVSDTSCPTVTNYNLTLSNLPGKPGWSTITGCLYKNNLDSTRMVTAWKVSSTSGAPCTTLGQWGVINWDSDDIDKTKVSESYISFNQQKEVIC